MRSTPDNTSPPDFFIHDSIFVWAGVTKEEDVDRAEDAPLPDWTMLSADCLVAIKFLIVSF